MQMNTINNVLYIDLAKRSFEVKPRADLFEKYLGGTGVATALLQEECPAGADPLGPENPIILAVGALTGMFPLMSKTVAMFKSPHNNSLGESHCGGRSAISIRLAGYGAIVIKNHSETPVYLAIHGDKVYIKDATTIWGLGNNFTVGRILREREPGSGMRSIMRIGRAGENLVTYAAVTTESYRHFGRLGLGAVFGSKMLKAIVISGKGSFSPEDMKGYRTLYDEFYQTAVNSPVMKKYHDLGTAANIKPLNLFGGLPTRNLQSAEFEDADKISGEAFAEQLLGRRLACSHCPVGCVHIAALRDPYEDEAYFYKTSMICYDYEPIFSLGSFLGGNDPKDILKLMDKIEVLGLDVMSAGVVLGWATEAMEKGMITTEDTLGLKLEWNNYKDYILAIDYITNQKNDFYKALAKGVDYASSKYGGDDFAMAFGGNEMPGYHTGPAAHVGFFVGMRHSHLDNAGYSVDQKFQVDKDLTPKQLAEKLVEEECWRQILSSLVCCFFARGIYSPEKVLEALKFAGYDLTPEDLTSIGKEIYKSKYNYKVQEGFSLTDYKLPERIYQTPSATGLISKEYVEAAIAEVKNIIDEI